MAANEIVSQMKKDKGVLLVLYGKGSKSNQWEIDALWYLIDGSDIRHSSVSKVPERLKKKRMDIHFNIFIVSEGQKKKEQDKIE
jgi:hypothetical protein